MKRHVTLYNAASAGTGSWVPLYIPRGGTDLNGRTLQISMDASDTITLQGTTREAADVADLGTVASEDITTIGTYTGSTDENFALVGTFTFIRVVKTGTNGIAKVQGNI